MHQVIFPKLLSVHLVYLLHPLLCILVTFLLISSYIFISLFVSLSSFLYSLSASSTLYHLPPFPLISCLVWLVFSFYFFSPCLLFFLCPSSMISFKSTCFLVSLLSCLLFPLSHCLKISFASPCLLFFSSPSNSALNDMYAVRVTFLPLCFLPIYSCPLGAG